MGYIDVEMPIRVDMGLDGIVGAIQSARLHVVEDADAPVVIEWDKNGRLNRFRAFEGRLMEQVNRSGIAGFSHVSDLAPRYTRRWSDVRVGDSDMGAFIKYPFPRANTNVAYDFPRMVRSPALFPELVAQMRAAKHEIGRCIAIGEELWEPSPGPLYRIVRGGGQARGGVEFVPGWVAHSYDSRSDCLSCFDLDAVSAAHRESFARAAMSVERPLVLSIQGWSMADVLQQQDLAACAAGMLIARGLSRSIAKDNASDRMIEAYVAVQESTEAEPVASRIEALTTFLSEVETLKMKAEDMVRARSWRLVMETIGNRLSQAPELKGFTL